MEGFVDAELESLVAMVNNDSHTRMGGLSRDSGGGARSYWIGDRVVFVSQATSYLHRGEMFVDYSPLAFECIVGVVPVKDTALPSVGVLGRHTRARLTTRGLIFGPGSISRRTR